MQHATVTAASAAPAAVSGLFERQPLAAALAFLAGSIVEARNTIPILSNVVISASDDGARIMGTDLDLFASRSLPAAWDVPGAICADVKALLAAVKGCEGDTVTLRMDGAAVIVSSDGMAARVPVLPADDMPRALPIGATSRIVLPAPVLADDLARVRPCISSEETRYYLNGIYFHSIVQGKDAPPTFGLAATDGHKLARIVRPMPAVEGEELPGAIVPRKLIDAMMKAMGKKPAGDVSLAFGAGKGRKLRVDVDVAGWTIESKLIDGTFPDYQRVIPSQNDKRAVFDAKALGAAVRKLANGMKAPAVKIELDKDGAKLSCVHPETGVRACPVAAAWAHDAFTIGANATYVQSLATACGEGDMALIMADACSPILIQPANAPEATFVLMPLRVGGETVAKAPAKRAATVEPVETPADIFRREYAEAYRLRMWSALAGALATYRASLIEQYGADWSRLHDQLAMTCANIRYRAALDAEASATADRERARTSRAALRDKSTIYSGDRRAGGFAAFLHKLAARAAAAVRYAPMIAAMEGYEADDARDVLPVILADGKRAFVMREAFADAQAGSVQLVKADGTPVIRRRQYAFILRADIARIVTPRQRKAPSPRVEASQDVETLREALAAVLTRVDALQATVERQAAALEAMEAPAATVAPVEAPAATDGRDAYIATLIAERDAAKARADDAEAALADMTTRFADMETRIGDADALAARAVNVAAGMRQARTATAKRMLAMREHARRQRVELQRLQPIAAMIAAVAAPTGDQPLSWPTARPAPAPAVPYAHLTVAA